MLEKWKNTHKKGKRKQFSKAFDTMNFDSLEVFSFSHSAQSYMVSSIKHVRSDYVILDLPPPCTCTYASSLQPLTTLVRPYGYYFIKKIWQRYILWITINQTTTKKRYKIKKLLYKTIGKYLTCPFNNQLSL